MYGMGRLGRLGGQVGFRVVNKKCTDYKHTKHLFRNYGVAGGIRPRKVGI